MMSRFLILLFCLCSCPGKSNSHTVQKCLELDKVKVWDQTKTEPLYGPAINARGTVCLIIEFSFAAAP